MRWERGAGQEKAKTSQTDRGLQLTFEMGEGGGAGISKNVTDRHGVTTDP